MLTIRQLVVQDHESIQRLIGERPEVFNGYTDDAYKKLVTETINEELLTNPLFFNLGMFHNDQLIGAGFFKEFTTQSAWVWGYWVGNKGNLGSIVRSREDIEDFHLAMRQMDKILFEEMEDKRKLNRFYLAYPYVSTDTAGLRSANMGNRLIDFLTRNNKFKDNTRINRYKFLTDCLIEPNTTPKYPYQQQIIGNRTYPIKLGIRIAFLDDTIPLQSIDNGSSTSPESPSII
jgi:hypothetical protein